jgi:hypothetical protein
VKLSHVLLANAVFFFLLAAICFSYHRVHYTQNGDWQEVWAYPLTRYGEVFLVIAVPLLIIGLLAVLKGWLKTPY